LFLIAVSGHFLDKWLQFTSTPDFVLIYDYLV